MRRIRCSGIQVAYAERWGEAMYKHILIPTDGSELSESAILKGVALAKSMNAKVTGVTVSAPFHAVAVEPLMVTDTPAQYKKDCEALAAKYLGAIEKAAKTTGLQYEGMHVVHDQPYEAIIGAAADKGCDLIVMASHGRRGVKALVLGSETTKVLTHSKIPVLVLR
jgi:nucleotide-binding universal stress UspA family protein